MRTSDPENSLKETGYRRIEHDGENPSSSLRVFHNHCVETRKIFLEFYADAASFGRMGRPVRAVKIFQGIAGKQNKCYVK